MAKLKTTTMYEVRDEDSRLVWPVLSSYDEALKVCARLKKDRSDGSFTVKHVTHKAPSPIECPRILERHAALGRTEVALTVLDHRDEAGMPLYAVELITAKADGSYQRDQIHLGHLRVEIERRLTDFHSGVVQAQRALGMTIDRQFA